MQIIELDEGKQSLHMTVEEFYNQFGSWGDCIEVLSSYNGKTLCRDYHALRYNKKKINMVGHRVISSIKSALVMNTDKTGVYPILQIWVVGDVERKAEELKGKEKMREQDEEFN